MKTIKARVINVKYLLLINSLLLLFACKKEEKLEWNAAMSRPDYYVSAGQHVFYLKEGKIIGSCATLTDIGNFGWAFPKSGRGTTTDILPDSVVVDYMGLTDKKEMWTFRGGMSLPTKLIDSLFKVGYVKKGEHKNFRNIITGLAPGGRICVWVDHVEIKRGIVPIEKKYFDYPVSVFEDSLEINNYLKHHPIDYSIWEKPDTRYEFDFGFCSEDNQSMFYFIYYNSKEGIRNTVFKEQIDFTTWNIPYGELNDLQGYNYQQLNESYSKIKKQLPVEVQIGWVNKNTHYFTYVVLPNNFPNKFNNSYINPLTNKKANYNRLVFGVEKDGEHCIVWLDGPGKQEKIMRFKGIVSKKDKNGKPLNKGTYAEEIIYY